MKMTKEFKKETLFIILCTFVLVLICLFASETSAEKICFAALYILAGGKLLINAIRKIAKGKIFSEELLMCIAGIGAFIIESYTEGIAVFLFYRFGEALADMAIDNSKAELEKLMDICPEQATKIDNGIEATVSPTQLLVGDTIIVRPGEKIPADGYVISGNSNIDTSSITGESVPRYVSAGDKVISGCISMDGMLHVSVTSAFEDSTVSNIIKLVKNEQKRKSKTEKFVARFVKIYTPLVIAVAVLYAVLLPLFMNANWEFCLKNALTFLVISCPCALVVSIPLTYFCGCARASREGLLIKGGNAMDSLNKVKTIVLDKTGTITKGKLKVTDIITNGISKKTLVRYAAFAEYASNHPIAQAIKEEYGDAIDPGIIEATTELSGYGIRSRVENIHILAGSSELMHEQGITEKLPSPNGTVVYVAVNGKYAGAIVLKDTLKEGVESITSRLHKCGIDKVLIFSGDNQTAVTDVTKAIGADGGYGNLLPLDKCNMLDKEMRSSKTAFVGDGINDAPALVKADVGISMGSLGSDAAIEASDIVIMGDDPKKIEDAIRISSKTITTAKENIVITLIVKFGILALSAFGYAPMWAAVAADVGMTIIAVLNSIISTGIFKKRKQ